MTLLKKAKNDQAVAKIGIFGDAGSGKTATAGLLGVGISKEFCDGRPVAMMDTESGSDFLVPIFEAEGVDLMILKSTAFADMQSVLREAESGECCALIVDSVTHAWTELQESFIAQLNKGRQARGWQKVEKLEFHHWGPIKRQWADWTAAFLSSPLHVIVCGRRGFEYEYQEDDKGRKELVKGDSKMRAEGQFGYEPSLLIEMERERSARTGGRFVHIAQVLKDRSWALNGKSLRFEGSGVYKAGGYRKVLKAFGPHFAALNLGGEHVSAGDSDSTRLFDEAGDDGYHRAKRDREVLLEEIEGEFTKSWPGHDAKSKKIKTTTLERVFGTVSWTKVKGLDLDALEGGLKVLRAVTKKCDELGRWAPDDVANVVVDCIADHEAGPGGYASAAEEVDGEHG